MAGPTFATTSPASGFMWNVVLYATTVVAMLFMLWSASAAEVAQEIEGASLYRQYCASCHGISGRGDGPVAQMLKTPPRPLTTLTLRNAGIFPADHVHQIIDGRKERRAHGGRNMPIWGTIFGLQAQGLGRNAPDTNTAISQRIAALVGYLKSIQVEYTASAGEEALTKDLLERHVKALRDRDLESIILDYAVDSVLVVPTGVLEGKEHIRGYYETLFTQLSQPSATFNVLEQTVIGNVAYIVWNGEAANNIYDFASETLSVEGGKIKYQIVALKIITK